MNELATPFLYSGIEEALRSAGLTRFARGLNATDLFQDIVEGGTMTLLAPVDAAFEALSLPFDELITSPDAFEARFDLFEYLVLRGPSDASGSRATHATLHGELVRLGRNLVLGRYGASRVLDTFTCGGCMVHVLEQCVFPVFPGDYVVMRTAKGSLRTPA